MEERTSKIQFFCCWLWWLFALFFGFLGAFSLSFHGLSFSFVFHFTPPPISLSARSVRVYGVTLPPPSLPPSRFLYLLVRPFKKGHRLSVLLFSFLFHCVVVVTVVLGFSLFSVFLVL
jgi:hypothetical protein